MDNEMDKDLISVVMPTYNRGYVIKKAIKSVIEQTYQNWELIIVDDASADATEDVIREINDPRIIYIKNEENRGANFSRNRGCEIAKGEYLAFLDSDNYWVSDKLEKQVRVLGDSGDDVAFVFCNVECSDTLNEKKWLILDAGFEVDDLKKILCKRNVIDTNAVLMKRKHFEQVGGFDEKMPRIQDWELFFRTLVVHGYEAQYISEILDYNILQPDSIGRNDKKLHDAALLFIEKHLNHLNADAVVWQFMNGVFRREFSGEEKQKCFEMITKSESLDSMDIVGAAIQYLYSQTRYYEMLLLWKEKMERCSNRTIFSEFAGQNKGIIALYGLGRWGGMVYEEMKNAGIPISYGIDRNVREFHDLTVIRPDEIPANIDVIIVTVFQQYREICGMLSEYYKGKIVSIGDIIMEQI